MNGTGARFHGRLATAGLLELLGVLGYSSESLKNAAPPGLILATAHVVACFLFASEIRVIAGEAFQKHRGLAQVFVFGFSLPLPIVGPLAVYSLLQIIRTPPPQKKERQLYLFGETELGQLKQSGPNQRHLLSTAGEIMNQRDSEARRNAILAMRHVPPMFAIPLLRRGLQDSDEQVRIYAQNILSRFVEQHEEDIKNIEKKADGGSTIRAQTTLAELYHEMVYLGLVTDDEVRSFYLEKAMQLLRDAHRQAPSNAGVLFQLLKYALQAERAEEADDALKKLRALDYPEPLLEPWDVELAFLRRDWRGFRDKLAAAQRSLLSEPKLKQLADFWLKKAPAHAD